MAPRGSSSIPKPTDILLAVAGAPWNFHNLSSDHETITNLSTEIKRIGSLADFFSDESYDVEDIISKLDTSQLQQLFSHLQPQTLEIINGKFILNPNHRLAGEAFNYISAVLKIVKYVLEELDIPSNILPHDVLLILSRLSEDMLNLPNSPPLVKHKQAVIGLCDTVFRQRRPGRCQIITPAIIVTLQVVVSMTPSTFKPADIRLLYSLRTVFRIFDYDAPESEHVREYLIRSVLNVALVQNHVSRKLLAFFMTLSPVLMQKMHEQIRHAVLTAPRAVKQAYADLYYRVWREASSQLEGEKPEKDKDNKDKDSGKDKDKEKDKDWTKFSDAKINQPLPGEFIAASPEIANIILHNLERDVVQNWIDLAIHSCDENQSKTALLILRDGFIAHRTTVRSIDPMLIRAYGPLLWRSLSATNPKVRLNATHAFVDVFPLTDSFGDSISTVSDMNGGRAVTQQCDDMLKLLMDPAPLVRCKAIAGTCHFFIAWLEMLPDQFVRKALCGVCNLSRDEASSKVRIEVCRGLGRLIDECIVLHSKLAEWLPGLRSLLHDKVERVQEEFLLVLHKVKHLRTIALYKVVQIEDIIYRLLEARPGSTVMSQCFRLLVDSFFVPTKPLEDQIYRAIKFIDFSPAGAQCFYGNVCAQFGREAAIRFAFTLLTVLSKEAHLIQTRYGGIVGVLKHNRAVQEILSRRQARQQRQEAGEALENNSDDEDDNEQVDFIPLSIPFKAVASVLLIISQMLASVGMVSVEKENDKILLNLINPSYLGIIYRVYVTPDTPRVTRNTFKNRNANIEHEESESDEEQALQEEGEDEQEVQRLRTHSSIQLIKVTLLSIASRLPPVFSSPLKETVSQSLMSLQPSCKKEQFALEVDCYCSWGQTPQLISSIAEALIIGFGPFIRLTGLKDNVLVKREKLGDAAEESTSQDDQFSLHPNVAIKLYDYLIGNARNRRFLSELEVDSSSLSMNDRKMNTNSTAKNQMNAAWQHSQSLLDSSLSICGSLLEEEEIKKILSSLPNPRTSASTSGRKSGSSSSSSDGVTAIGPFYRSRTFENATSLASATFEINTRSVIHMFALMIQIGRKLSEHMALARADATQSILSNEAEGSGMIGTTTSRKSPLDPETLAELVANDEAVQELSIARKNHEMLCKDVLPKISDRISLGNRCLGVILQISGTYGFEPVQLDENRRFEENENGDSRRAHKITARSLQNSQLEEEEDWRRVEQIRVEHAKNLLLSIARYHCDLIVIGLALPRNVISPLYSWLHSLNDMLSHISLFDDSDSHLNVVEEKQQKFSPAYISLVKDIAKELSAILAKAAVQAAGQSTASPDPLFAIFCPDDRCTSQGVILERIARTGPLSKLPVLASGYAANSIGAVSRTLLLLPKLTQDSVFTERILACLTNSYPASSVIPVRQIVFTICASIAHSALNENIVGVNTSGNEILRINSLESALPRLSAIQNAINKKNLKTKGVKKVKGKKSKKSDVDATTQEENKEEMQFEGDEEEQSDDEVEEQIDLNAQGMKNPAVTLLLSSIVRIPTTACTIGEAICSLAAEAGHTVGLPVPSASLLPSPFLVLHSKFRDTESELALPSSSISPDQDTRDLYTCSPSALWGWCLCLCIDKVLIQAAKIISDPKTLSLVIRSLIVALESIIEAFPLLAPIKPTTTSISGKTADADVLELIDSDAFQKANTTLQALTEEQVQVMSSTPSSFLATYKPVSLLVLVNLDDRIQLLRQVQFLRLKLRSTYQKVNEILVPTSISKKSQKKSSVKSEENSAVEIQNGDDDEMDPENQYNLLSQALQSHAQIEHQKLQTQKFKRQLNQKRSEDDEGSENENEIEDDDENDDEKQKKEEMVRRAIALEEENRRIREIEETEKEHQRMTEALLEKLQKGMEFDDTDDELDIDIDVDETGQIDMED